MEFKATKQEMQMIIKIAMRAMKEVPIPGQDMKSQVLDLDACHSNGCPLDFEKFLTAPAYDFAHDIEGIHKYIDRGTGKITDFFRPRCAKG